MSDNDSVATVALGDVLRERVRHTTDLGYDRDHDDALPVDFLPRQASQRMTIAMDRLATGGRRDLVGARKALVQSAALTLAAIDRLDRAIARSPGASLFDDPPGETPLHQRDWHG
jgi:hypothetical protein